jgi:ferredoxin--NADP+ reductase
VTHDQPNAVVSQRTEVSPGLIILRVVPDGWEAPEFIPGQFAVLGLPGSAPRCVTSDTEEEARPRDKLIKRAYSLASSSVTRMYLEFYISLVHSGTLTPRLFALERGDRLWVSPKTSGLFTLAEVPADQHILLIATGTGLAPYMSVLRSRLVCGGERRFGVLHGARHSWDLGYQSELLAMQRTCGNFAYISTISRPEEEPVAWHGHRGYLQELWTIRSLKEAWESRHRS